MGVLPRVAQNYTYGFILRQNAPLRKSPTHIFRPAPGLEINTTVFHSFFTQG